MMQSRTTLTGRLANCTLIRPMKNRIHACSAHKFRTTLDIYLFNVSSTYVRKNCCSSIKRKTVNMDCIYACIKQNIAFIFMTSSRKGFLLFGLIYKDYFKKLVLKIHKSSKPQGVIVFSPAKNLENTTFCI